MLLIGLQQMKCVSMNALFSEAIKRAVQQAKTEGAAQVEGSHLEKVIPQIVSRYRLFVWLRMT